MITEIEIENYKCFKYQKVSFRRLTILAGANSVGKSSVIQSLLLSRIAYERLKVVNFSDTALITVPINGEYQLALGNVAEVLNRNASEDILRFTFNGELQSLVKIEMIAEESESSYELPIIGRIPDSGQFPNFSLFADQFHYLSAERLGPRLKYEVESMPYLRVGFQGENSLYVLSYKLTDVPLSRAFPSDKPSNLFQQAGEWMNFIVPGTSIDNVELKRKIKTAEISYGLSSPTNVGFGISYVLPIVLSGLIAAENSMLVVENPEAHLHPLGQSRIGYFLAWIAASGVQVVIETHSEHVINGIRVVTLDKDRLSPSDAIVNFFSRNSEGEIDLKGLNFTSMGDLDRWPRDFFDQQQQDFASIIKLRGKAQ